MGGADRPKGVLRRTFEYCGIIDISDMLDIDFIDNYLKLIISKFSIDNFYFKMYNNING